MEEQIYNITRLLIDLIPLISGYLENCECECNCLIIGCKSVLCSKGCLGCISCKDTICEGCKNHTLCEEHFLNCKSCERSVCESCIVKCSCKFFWCCDCVISEACGHQACSRCIEYCRVCKKSNCGNCCPWSTQVCRNCETSRKRIKR